MKNVTTQLEKVITREMDVTRKNIKEFWKIKEQIRNKSNEFRWKYCDMS